MSPELKVEDLENSLLQRADELADEYIQRAKRSHDHFIEDENERLQLREEREIMAAKVEAERTYRSRVQASELQAQKQLDQMRWQLIKDVLIQVNAELEKIVAHPEKYRQTIIHYIQQGIDSISDDELIIQSNQRDHQGLKENWSEICKQLGGNKQLVLSGDFHKMSGGVLIYNKQQTIRINNTFEGRMERFAAQINQRVAEQFFSELSHEGDKIHGR